MHLSANEKTTSYRKVASSPKRKLLLYGPFILVAIVMIAGMFHSMRVSELKTDSREVSGLKIDSREVSDLARDVHPAKEIPALITTETRHPVTEALRRPKPIAASIAESICGVDLDASESRELSASSIYRPSVGTNAPLPPIHYEETRTEAKLPLATLCMAPDVPLHVLVELVSGPDDDAQTAVPLYEQLNLLMNGDGPGSLVSNVIVTVLKEVITTSGRRVAFGVLHYFSSNASLLLATGETSVIHDDGARPAEVAWPQLVGDIRRALGAEYDRWRDGATAPEGIKFNKDVSLSTRLASYATVLSAVSIDKPAHSRPHFVFALPYPALFTHENIRGLCYLDAVVNEESEATSYYPFAEPFVPKSRKLLTNGRLSVGFLFASNSEAPSAPSDPHRGVGGDVTLVSSCRRPTTLQSRQVREFLGIDSKHYSKGGDMVSRGALWCLDVGSALRKTTQTGNRIVPRERAVLVPYLAGVHTDVLLGVSNNNDAVVGLSTTLPSVFPKLTNGQRLHLFPLKRPIIDTHCSSDPSNPVRVSTFMNGYVNAGCLHMPRNGFDIPLRTINATALMTGYSDLMIATNLDGEDLMRVYWATTRGLSAATFVNKTAAASAPSDLGKHFLDINYPNPHGELVITTFHKQARGTWRVISGDTIYRMVSHMGFYDIVRYSEEDIYLSRDQFEHYCAMLSFLEEREEFLNYLRFEAFWELLDESPSPSPPVPRNAGYQWKRVQIDVLQRRLPNAPVIFTDQTIAHPWGFRAGRAPYAVRLRRTDPLNVPTNRNTVPYPIPMAPPTYDVEEIPVEQCRFVGPDKSTHLVANTASDVSGCYTFVHAYSPQWQMKHIYPAQWVLPTHRLQHWFLDGSKTAMDGSKSATGSGVWRGYDKGFSFTSQKYAYNWDPTGVMYGEFIAYLGSPMQTYTNGGIYAVYMEEGEGLESYKERELGGRDYGKANQTFHGLHRLTTVNHGRNGLPYEKPPAEAFRIPRIRVPS